MTRGMRVASAFAVGALASLALTGCLENSPQGDLRISAVAGQLVVANCGPDIAAPFEVLISEIDYPDSWTVLDGASETAWNEGETRSGDPALWHAVDDSAPAELAPRHLVNVYFQNDVDSARASFTIPAEGLRDGEWLSYDDTISATACGDPAG